MCKSGLDRLPHYNLELTTCSHMGPARLAGLGQKETARVAVLTSCTGHSVPGRNFCDLTCVKDSKS
jgi:hypothetical protein